RDNEEYRLRHYHDDTFVWNVTYDDTVKRAQYCRAYPYYRIEFKLRPSKKGILVRDPIDSLRWRHDSNVPEGDVFARMA
ncbi:hypothetical protein MMC14_010233, partial [Varicellaria rhodocarpa]|nr:hypothetical protein [Varicellaria rhodocarpa]